MKKLNMNLSMRVIITIFTVTLLFCFDISFVKAKTLYTCPMHPHVISDKEGSCPICGMDLVLISYEEDVAEKDAKQDNEEQYPIIKLSERTMNNINVELFTIKYDVLGKKIRSFGNIAINERLSYNISSRVSGWIEDLTVRAVGDIVKKDDLLYKIYSPDLISAQTDYISALKTGVKYRINSTKKHLILLGVQEKTIKQIKKSKKYLNKLPFYSEIDGVVHHININQGSYVSPGMELANLQDYSSVWVNAKIFEADLALLDSKALAKIKIDTINKQYDAEIDYIYPIIDEVTRTVNVRFILNNEEGILKPGSFVDVMFEIDPKKRLVIPSEAVLRSVNKNYVILFKNKGQFIKKEVVLGIENKGELEILNGLREGDKIVIRAQFLIDADSFLKESFSKIKHNNGS